MTIDNRPHLDDAETHAIFGAAITVHRKMGRGFLEHVYAPCLAIEFQRRSIPFEREVLLKVEYDGVPLPVSFRPDFVCFGSIIVEVKALSSLTARDDAQLISYLKASGMHRGVLLNFGSDILGKRRLVWQLPIEIDAFRKRKTIEPAALRRRTHINGLTSWSERTGSSSRITRRNQKLQE